PRFTQLRTVRIGVTPNLEKLRITGDGRGRMVERGFGPGASQHRERAVGMAFERLAESPERLGRPLYCEQEFAEKFVRRLGRGRRAWWRTRSFLDLRRLSQQGDRALDISSPCPNKRSNLQNADAPEPRDTVVHRRTA